MSKHFLQYWKPKQVDYDISVDPVLTHTASEQLYRVSPHDVIWIVTVRPVGQLSLVGRLQVGEVTGLEEARRKYDGDIYVARFHAFPKGGTAQPFNEMSLMDIAEKLRFVSSTKKDRLNISHRGVDGKQLQTIRELTPASASLLETKWSDTQFVIEFENAVRKGAGFGNSETNRKVEKAAISFVTTWYESQGWNVKSVELNKRGYDLFCTKAHLEEHVEVKGVQGQEPSFIVTSGEVKQAQNNKQFIICIVTSALNNPRMVRYMGNEFVKHFALSPLAYRAYLQS